MEQGDKNGICRVCLRRDIRKYLSIFEYYNDCLISDKINIISSIEIRKGDGLPDKICPDCLLELENAVVFKQKCESSNAILHSSIVNRKDEVVVKQEITVEFTNYEYNQPLYNDPYFKQESVDKEKKDCTIGLQLKCDDCEGIFKSKYRLCAHWKREHQKNQLVCHRCKQQFKSYKAFNGHKTNTLKSCTAAAFMHIEGVGRDRVFHCKECKYTSKIIKDMSAHLVLHSGERPFVCSYCNKGYSQQSSLHSHLEAAHGKFKVETTCQFCGKHIKGRTKLYKHMRQHKGLQVQCEICKKIFKSKQYLIQHMKRHSGVKGYSCEICAAAFYTTGELAGHRQTTHFKVKKFKCDLCDYLAFKAVTIKCHRAKHTATNIPCLICGMFSQNQEEFLVHQKRHFCKNYQCPHCEKKFFARKGLSKHVRDKHKCTMLINKPVQPVIVKEETPSSVIYKQQELLSDCKLLSVKK